MRQIARRIVRKLQQGLSSMETWCECWNIRINKGKTQWIGYWWEIHKERDHWEDQDVGGWTILKLILER
jgi:hypothetical protein